MSSAELIREDVDGVAQLWLKRPAKRNAISESLYVALRDSLRAIERDDSVRVVVLRSGVPGIFCAGADIETMADPRPAELQRQFELLLDCVDAFRSCAKLVVTAVEGACHGVGCALVAASDIAVARADAHFALPEIKLALAPVLAMAALMPVTARRQLVYWSATGRLFSAQEACAAGLITSAVAADEFDGFVTQLCADLGSADSTALAQVKATARKLAPSASPDLRAQLMQDMIVATTQPAARTAIEAFLQRKRRA